MTMNTDMPPARSALDVALWFLQQAGERLALAPDHVGRMLYLGQAVHLVRSGGTALFPGVMIAGPGGPCEPNTAVALECAMLGRIRPVIRETAFPLLGMLWRLYGSPDTGRLQALLERDGVLRAAGCQGGIIDNAALARAWASGFPGTEAILPGRENTRTTAVPARASTQAERVRPPPALRQAPAARSGGTLPAIRQAPAASTGETPPAAVRSSSLAGTRGMVTAWLPRLRVERATFPVPPELRRKGPVPPAGAPPAGGPRGDRQGSRT